MDHRSLRQASILPRRILPRGQRGSRDHRSFRVNRGADACRRRAHIPRPWGISMKVRALSVSLALILAATSCTVEKPAEVNTLNEAKAVRALSQEWLKAEIAKDIPTILSF